MALRGKKPEKKEKRLKLFVYGEAGVGKTLAALDFPKSYIIDTEKGTDFYSDTINKNESAVFQSCNPDEIKGEIKELLTSKHPYKTLVIDPITQIYNACQDKWTRIFERHSNNPSAREIQDFGLRYWGKVKSDFKCIQRMILNLDMNVIITAHQKDKYGSNQSLVGVTFDSMKGDDYIFDYIFRIVHKARRRVALTAKERAEPGKNKFPEEFEWSYENFCKFYGDEIIERDAVPVPMASEEEVNKIDRLIGLLSIPDETISKWYTKYNISNFNELTAKEIGKITEFLNKKVKELEEIK